MRSLLLSLAIAFLLSLSASAQDRWEYQIGYGCNRESLSVGQGTVSLASLGEQGWELVSVTRNDTSCEHYFKRPLAPGAVASSPPKSSPPAAPQCNLTLAESPAVRGLRLGMTPDQVAAIFPNPAFAVEIKRRSLVPAEENLGGFTVGASRSEYKDLETTMPGIAGFGVGFFDGKANYYEVAYENDNRANWTLENWLEKVIGAYHLPNLAFWKGINTGYAASLKCAGFEVNVTKNLTVRVSGPSIKEEVQRRQDARSAKFRETLKP